ncbi:helicase associated domain-containing protein [Streptomyces sp. BPTC-684]|uniref:helicase associated domain-containing protein n=1 Tax=Streptomyces sp. BPTC-684 TaxID=3043734 RepID=UPI0024B150FE|nr:helicase associated domain-containing protein [Streptomyces sp. BPTC-684]WHM40940.1 helicase associated domain-containing protein [Streptomyces sp. BPTC-684]
MRFAHQLPLPVRGRRHSGHRLRAVRPPQRAASSTSSSPSDGPCARLPAAARSPRSSSPSAWPPARPSKRPPSRARSTCSTGSSSASTSTTSTPSTASTASGGPADPVAPQLAARPERSGRDRARSRPERRHGTQPGLGGRLRDHPHLPPRPSIEYPLTIARDYTAHHGHLVPRVHESPDGFPLGRWVAERRREAREGSLPHDYLRVLWVVPPAVVRMLWRQRPPAAGPARLP